MKQSIFKNYFILILTLFFVNSYANANFFQNAGSKYDVLFVMDDSADMTTIKYKEGLTTAVSKLIDLNVHIGMITTSDYDQSYPRVKRTVWEFIPYSSASDKSHTDNVVDYLLSVPYNGSGTEKFFPNIVGAFQNSDSSLFFRQDATLVIFIVSTAVDQSELSSLDFLKKLEVYKSLTHVYIRAALTAPHDVNDNNCKGEIDSSNLSFVPKLNELMNYSKIDVKMISLCSKDWSSLIDFN